MHELSLASARRRIPSAAARDARDVGGRASGAADAGMGGIRFFRGRGGGVILLLLYIMRKLEATLPPPLGSPFLPFSVILRNLEEKGEEEKEGRRKGDTNTHTDGRTDRQTQTSGWVDGPAGGRTDGRADTREKGAFETERERPFDGLLLCHLLLDLTFRSCTSPPLGPFPFPY